MKFSIPKLAATAVALEWVVGVLIGASACGGCSTRNADAKVMDVPADAKVMDVPATTEQLGAFHVALNRWSSLEATAPDDVNAMVSSVEVAIVGVLGPAGVGRKAYQRPSFDTYANLELRDVQVLRGSLEKPGENAYLEVHWPINLAPDELVKATPVGARVIVLADHVDGALEAAQMLERELHIDAVASVKTNLLSAPPYGLLVEGLDGDTYLPLSEDGALVMNGAELLTTFNGALAAIRSSAQR
jgi:hypothetical protein